jgi:hypothetical protein
LVFTKKKNTPLDTVILKLKKWQITSLKMDVKYFFFIIFLIGPMKLLLVILFVIILVSKGSYIDFLLRETPVISTKIGNYTAVEKLFFAFIVVYFICF